MAYLNTIIIFLALLVLSCAESPVVVKEFVAPEKKLILDIQPFDDLPDSYLNYVDSGLKKIFTDVRILKAIPMPSSALNYNKTRYRADSLISYLSRLTQAGHVTLGLTTKDISTTKGNIADWGVMGLSWCPGNSCVASSFRLKSGKKTIQLFKVSIHELGHTQGLPHCPVDSCYMRDAKGKNHTDEETCFCLICKMKLKEAGWILN